MKENRSKACVIIYGAINSDKNEQSIHPKSVYKNTNNIPNRNSPHQLIRSLNIQDKKEII